MLDGDNFTETDLLINNEHFFVDRIAEALFWEPGVDGKFTEQFSGHMHDYAQTQLLCNELQPSSNKFKPTRVRRRKYFTNRQTSIWNLSLSAMGIF